MHNYLDDLNVVKDILIENKIILSPTDTVWGLGCSAYSKIAVDKIYDIKNRDADKPLILLVHNIQLLKQYIKEIHPRIETLIHFHQRPLSVIYEANENLPTYLTSDYNTVAIRVTKHPLLVDLISALGHPLVSTSANIQGEPAPQLFSQVESNVIEKVDYVFNEGRQLKETNPPSMLIKFDEDGELIFLRK